MHTAVTWWENHFTQFIEDLTGIIAIPSISVENPDTPETPYGKPCSDVLDFIRELGKGYGFVQENCDYQYEILSVKGKKESTIGIFSHLDVVPVGPGWKYDPFVATVTDCFIIGRGSGDNKGPSIAVMYALRYLVENGWKPTNTIHHFFGVNEECGMKDIQHYTKQNPMPIFSLVADAAFSVCHGEKGVLVVDCEHSMHLDSNILMWETGVASNSVPALAVAELSIDAHLLQSVIPSGDDVVIVKIADGRSKLTVKGTAAHAAFPEGSENAQTKMAAILFNSGLFAEEDQRFLASLISLFTDYYGKGVGLPYEDELSGRLTHVAGFSAFDRTKSKIFHQNINIRYTITADFETLIKSLGSMLEKHGFILTSYSDSPPMYVEKTLPVVQKLIEISREITGMDLPPYVMGGGTYARKLQNAVGFGPGLPYDSDFFGVDRGRGHQPDEYITFDKLKKCFLAYVKAISEVDKFYADTKEMIDDSK